ncbi:hypothetical protein AVEN_3812-1 [Araneus ventricosus]|uniref:Integrase catalytic domain-containing protein n=1 Tax=Araneus ventricosus TaxID=182803 RepID=A0A4Y2HE30_ARAVE|nr:hypothetical protein AVEN_3812-1 [Araneus ventricosus]
MKAETCVHAILQQWIARFGVPEIVSTDRGSQLEFELFQSFTRFLGSERIQTTSYHPASNGMLGRFHRQLTDAIRYHFLATTGLTGVLPLVLLGICASLKEDLGVSSA